MIYSHHRTLPCNILLPPNSLLEKVGTFVLPYLTSMTHGFTVVLRAKDDEYSGYFILGGSMVVPKIWLVQTSMTVRQAVD